MDELNLFNGIINFKSGEKSLEEGHFQTFNWYACRARKGYKDEY